MRKSVFTTVLAAVFAVLAMTPAFAGNLDQTAAPTDPASAMFTLEDIYQRLATGATGTKRVGPFANPTSGPGATGHTLDEVMGKAPAVDAGGASPADVAAGKKFWGLQTGTGYVRTCTGTLSAGGRWCDYGVAVGTVMDMTTGLVWLRNANCSANLAGINKTGQLNWSDAVVWSSAVKSGVCGLTDSSVEGDWRLPTLSELKTLTTGTENVLSGSPGSFTAVLSNLYWSATTSADYPTGAWGVNLSDGGVSYGAKSYTLYVWPVR